MPRKARITKEDIASAAFDLVREKGAEALNARALADALSCSTQPIFSNYTGMDEIISAVLERSLALYREYTRAELERGEYSPPYKAMGMAYIRMAKYDRNIFRLLFMRDRKSGREGAEDGMFHEVVSTLMTTMGMGEEEARLFHLEMWVVVHGIASMIATSYVEWNLEDAGRVLTDIFTGVRKIHTERK